MRPARGTYVALAVATIAVGLAVHLGGSAMPAAARDFVGDALWAAMIAWWVGAAVPDVALPRRAAVALALCFVVEVSQLYHAPALDAVRGTTLGHLVLGSGFDARDLAAYALGVLVAALIERAADRVLLVAGLLQLAAVFTPAAHARVVGGVPFVRLPTAGVALVTLGAATLVVSLWRRGWWRRVPGALSALVLAVVYWRLTRAPSGTIADPLLRRVLHPSWGFVPMTLAVLLALVGTVRWREPRGAGSIGQNLPSNVPLSAAEDRAHVP
ncbi:Protein of unknown function DUF2809 (plasmid) [Gemmatirosa kalamazoonensis]|uniref:Uncharacterized protein n=1 Tax=Gemmatirosa kalamazoonensis TaxID=861299 RepID=W0RQ03_9BACT|nr:DUF2809 domain-containing protein [Gemmatirosa kalamazoonensis]AHG92776.1 Protein of unknown function DUF2809 [Gemmatirosa kalamazoonensis]